MLPGISVICFAASYLVALVLELTRPLFRSGLRGALMIAFAAAGFFAHTLFLYYHAISATGSPLSSKRDWYLVAAWVLAGVYLYLASYHPRTAFGVFILPLVLGLIGTGALLADPRPFPREPASRVWGIIHAASLLLATVAVLVGFAAGLMYLWQARRLKQKLPPPRGLRLPSLEWLQRTNSRAVVIALLMLGLGILAGIVLNMIDFDPSIKRVPWYDPFIVSTLLMFVWLLIATGIVAFYRPAREGRKVAYLTLVSFLFLIVALGVGLSGRTEHGGVEELGLRSHGLELRDQTRQLSRAAASGLPGFRTNLPVHRSLTNRDVHPPGKQVPVPRPIRGCSLSSAVPRRLVRTAAPGRPR